MEAVSFGASSAGIRANDRINITGGNVSAKGDYAAIYADLITIADPMTIITPAGGVVGTAEYPGGGGNVTTIVSAPGVTTPSKEVVIGKRSPKPSPDPEPEQTTTSSTQTSKPDPEPDPDPDEDDESNSNDENLGNWN